MSQSTPKLDVLFITRKWSPAVGGMEEYSHRLTEHLDRLARITVRALPGRQNGQPPRMARLFGFGLTSAWYLLRRTGRFEVIHLGDMALWPLGLIAALRNRKAQLFASAHGTDIAYPLRRGLLPWLYAIYLKTGALLCPRLGVIANSRATGELCRKAGFRLAAVIPLGVEIASEPAEINPPSPYVLFVGRLVRRKGCRWFIEEVLPRLDNSLTLVVAGTEWDADETRALDDRRVDFRGPVYGRELADLRRNAVVVVMPNIGCDGRDFEGFGLTAVETAADQGVLLAAAIDGIVDAVVDGTTGFLLPAEQPEAWCDKIVAIAGWSLDRRQTFVRQAYDHVLREFGWGRVADATYAAYMAERAA